MKVLKGMALGLAGFFLLAALIILGLAFTLNGTVLNPQFVLHEVEKLDITSIAQQILNDQLPSEAKPYLPAIDAALNENKPWISEQVRYTVNASYDYLLGRTNTFNITISTGPVKQSLSKNLTQAYVQSPPPGYLQLAPTQQANFLNQFQQQVTNTIPSTIAINRDNIPAEVWQAVQQAKDIISHVRTAYFSLLAFSLVLILLIIFMTREVKGAAISLGTIFLISGAMSLAGFMVLKQWVPGAIPMNGLPPQIQTWLPQVITDTLSPWGIFGAAVLAMGILLLVVSFFFRSKQSEPAIAPLD